MERLPWFGFLLHLFLTLGVALGLTGSAGAVSIDWVPVGNPGNETDDTGRGLVDYVYLISKYETTNAQYAEFLNAVAATDTYELYNVSMGSDDGGITRSGSPGSYTYSAVSGRENMPVNNVSWYDSLRFANWLHNGQPTGAQNSTTTEDGAYTFSGVTSVGTRNAGATIFLPTEDEWYKAAYYDALSMSYFDYPAGTDVQTTCAWPSPTANTANCGNAVGDLTDVGSYTSSASPNGTFDQGGNVWEWSERSIGGGEIGIQYGGGFTNSPDNFEAASFRRFVYGTSLHNDDVGFRVAMIPEPSTALLVACGLLGLGLKRKPAT